MPYTKYIQNEQHGKEVLAKVKSVKSSLWIGTADIKDLYLGDEPFLEVIAGLIKKGVHVRLIHAKEPGPNFREDFDRYPRLARCLERVLCPRVHFKCVIIDGTFAWFGSANLTGAGMGAKSERKRNFENGVVTDESTLIEPLEEQFDAVWRGDFCMDCGRKDYCIDPIKDDV